MTTTEATRASLEKIAATPQQKTIIDLLERQRPAIEKVLPQTIGAERFTRIALTELRRNPALYDCAPDSLLGALMLSAQLGLEPGPLGHVYLVPYKKVVTFIIGYTGMIELAFRSGRLKDIQAEIVYEHDLFTYKKGTSPKLDHTPTLNPADRGPAVAVYAVARLTTGGAPFVVLSPQEVEARRKRSAAASAGKGPWTTDTDAMWRKSAVRALRPWLPASADFARALTVDESPVVELRDAEVILDVDPEAEEIEFGGPS
jgi:recombination protein RecT